MARDSSEKGCKDLEKTIRSLKHEIERLQAINEIQNLMSKHEYLHATNHHREVMELYAQNSPDVRIAMKEMGYWQGPDAIVPNIPAPPEPYKTWEERLSF